MSNLQTTIKSSITLKGVGIHTGKDVSLTFKPAEEDVGYVFSRTDLPNKPSIKALSEYVCETQRGTTLEKDGVKLKTTEHVLAALVGLEIDNITCFGFFIKNAFTLLSMLIDFKSPNIFQFPIKYFNLFVMI